MKSFVRKLSLTSWSTAKVESHGNCSKIVRVKGVEVVKVFAWKVEKHNIHFGSMLLLDPIQDENENELYLGSELW